MTKLKNKLFAAILLVCLMLATVVAGFLCISPQIVSASSPQTDTYHRLYMLGQNLSTFGALCARG